MTPWKRNKGGQDFVAPCPSALGYRMPAEWEPHAASWLAWPHFHSDWPGKFEPIPWVYAEIIRNLAKHERVELIVNAASAARQARRVLERAHALSNNIRFHRWPTNRVWLRDSGCIFLTPLAGFARPDSRGGCPHMKIGKGTSSPVPPSDRKRTGLQPLRMIFSPSSFALMAGPNIPTGDTTTMLAAGWPEFPLLAQKLREKWATQVTAKKSGRSRLETASSSRVDRST